MCSPIELLKLSQMRNQLQISGHHVLEVHSYNAVSPVEIFTNDRRILLGRSYMQSRKKVGPRSESLACVYRLGFRVGGR